VYKRKGMSFAPPNRGKGWAALRKVVAVDGVDILKKATGNEALWMMLSEMLMSASFADESETEGVAGAHLHAVRMQAAHEIIRHRGELLYDITDSRPRHRTHLERVDLKYQPHADQALTECTRRLLGQQPGLHLVEVKLDPTDTTQASAWAATYRFIIGRFTTTHDEALMLQATRRKPSTIHPDATAAIVAVIEEIGHEAIGAAISAPHWSVLQRASTSRAGGDAEGAAAAHRQADREAAARKLIGNHENVLRDVANPSFDTNIDGKPLTQLELQRVDAGSAFYADQFLREVARRLLGRRAGLHQLEVRMDPANEAQATAWSTTAKYLDGRLQAMPEEKPGRTPDLPPLAAAAMRAVLHEVATPSGFSATWSDLEGLLDASDYAVIPHSVAFGRAAQHTHDAREEAARALVYHRKLVLRDEGRQLARARHPSTPPKSPSLGAGGLFTINPSPPEGAKTDKNRPSLEGIPAFFAHQCLREIARRLLGHRARGVQLLEEPFDPSHAPQAVAWARTARFVGGIFAPDEDARLELSPAASAAILDVAEEVGCSALAATLAATAPHWEMLHEALETGGSTMHTEADGAAAAHTHAAREAAARKLIGNHENVLRDVANPSAMANIDGKPLTQIHLKRVPVSHAYYADQTLREVARRLLGRRAGLHQLEVRMDPANEAQATAWAETALYLDGRLQAMPEEKPGRTPDLPPLAAAAMRAVLHEVGDVRIVISSTFARMTAQWALLRRAMELPTGRLPGGAWLGATEQQAAALLVHNKESIIAYLTSSTGSPNKPFGEGVDAQAAPRRILDALSSAAISTDIARLGISSIVHCEQVLREVCRQLLGQKFGGAQRNPRDERQATTWATTTMLIHQQILPALVKGLPLHNQDPVANVMAAALYRVGQLVPPTAMKDEASRKLQNAAATRKLRERQPSEIAAEAMHKPQAPRPSPPVPRWPVQASARPPMNPSRALVSSILDPSSVSTGVGFSAPKLRRSSAEAILPVGVSVGADDAFLVSASAPPMHFRSTRPGSHQRSEHSQIDDPRSASHVAPVATPRSVLERVRAHQLGVHERPIDRGYVPTVLPMHLQEEVLSPASSTSKHAVVTR